MEDYNINEAGKDIFMYCMECNQYSTQIEIKENNDECPYCSAFILELFSWKQFTSQNFNLLKTPKKIQSIISLKDKRNSLITQNMIQAFF